jgi:hypothetical protein
LKITKSFGYFTSGLIFMDRVEGFGNGNVKKLGNLHHSGRASLKFWSHVSPNRYYHDKILEIVIGTA